MKNLTKQTKPISGDEIKRDWHLVDATGKIVGRITPEIARLLQGKNKTNYVPYLDIGDYVVVVNINKMVISGRKADTKMYTKYSGYPGGLKRTKYSDLFEKNPGEIIRHAVSGMLPKNKNRKERLKRLFVFKDDNHPYKDKFNDNK
ncbi:50S ribosomal protein L13 [Microgenomates bacterium UTCPR1]|nr:MAG: 50S ribosomal protein L13 [Microgenomates bacterium UTCPR1]